MKQLREYCAREGKTEAHMADMLAVMDRDRRLTGYLRGQVDQPTAPAGFELSNGWRVSYTTFLGTRCISGHNTDQSPYRSRSASCKYIQRHPETDDGTLCANFFPLVTIETNTKKSQISASIICEVAHGDGVEHVQLLCKISRAAIPMAARVVSTNVSYSSAGIALELPLRIALYGSIWYGELSIADLGMTMLATEMTLELRSWASFYCANTMRVNDPKRIKPYAYARANDSAYTSSALNILPKPSLSVSSS